MRRPAALRPSPSRVAVLRARLPVRRRDAHRRLATVVDDIEERARHLALATTEPDRRRRRSWTPPRLMRRPAAQHRRRRARGPRGRPHAADVRDSPPTTTPRRCPTAVARRGPRRASAQIHDELIAATPPGVRSCGPAPGRGAERRDGPWRSGQRCASGAPRSGPDDARVIELLGQPAIYRSLAGETRDRLASGPRCDGSGRTINDPRLLVIAQGRVAYIETHTLTSHPACSREPSRRRRARVPLPST